MIDKYNIIGFLKEFNINLPLEGGISVTNVTIMVVIFFTTRLLFWFLQNFLLHYIHSLTKKTKTDFDGTVVQAIRDIRPWVYNVASIYITLSFLVLPATISKVITGIFYFSIVWQSIEITVRILNYIVNSTLNKNEINNGEVDPNAATTSHLVSLIAKVVLWSLGVLFVLSNMGIEVTSLIAGMGIGGVAVALALQGILGDLFASFSLYFDKPFRIGDFVVIGGDSGIVERIGIKSTRIRTLQGEELVISNNELTTARVQNFKKMQERRVVTKFGIVYETSEEKVKVVPEIVNKIFHDLSGARLDRVHFTTFGDSALIFELVYYVESADYLAYLNIQQAFNYNLLSKFSEQGINFAYPTQTIYTKSIS